MPHRELTMKGFLTLMEDASYGARQQRFCFVLGAGASVESEIPTGMQLVNVWDQDLADHLPNGQYVAWKQALGIVEANKFEHYSDYYAKRFENEPEIARNYIEKQMEDKCPSCGYVILSHILAKTQHNIIITTNFDHLSEDAVSYYAHQMPLVLGHEALAPHFSEGLRRPIIIKIHRDLLLDPASSPSEISTLSGKWRDVLDRIFRNYHPVFVGYAGNDPSLMNFLLDVAPLFNNKTYKTPYWLLYRETEPKGSIADFLDHAHGVFVEHEGFDSTMVLLGKALNYHTPSREDFLADGEARYQRLTEAMKKFTEEQKKRDLELENQRKSDELQVTTALEEISGTATQETPERMLRNIWSLPYEQQIATLQKASQRFPKNAGVFGTYAVVEEIHGSYNQAEAYYAEAFAIEPNNARVLGDYARFLYEVRKDYDATEAYYKRALEADLKNAIILGNYANFLKNVRKDYDAAEAYYKRALEADPKHVIILGNYANFLCDVRKDYDTAEAYYKRVLEADPKFANNLGNYAEFLWLVRKNYELAEEYYINALGIDPNMAYHFNMYATFLCDVRHDYDAAEKYYKLAVEKDPSDSKILKYYADFLKNIRHDVHGADELLQQVSQDKDSK